MSGAGRQRVRHGDRHWGARARPRVLRGGAALAVVIGTVLGALGVVGTGVAGATGTTLYASPTGPTSASCTSSTPCSLQHAITTAADTDTIALGLSTTDSGTYTGTYTITSKTLTIEPAPSAAHVVLTTTADTGPIFDVAESAAVTIEHVTLQGGKGGVRTSSSDLTLLDDTLTGSSGAAVFATGGNDVLTNDTFADGGPVGEFGATLQITDDTFLDDSATTHPWGIAAYPGTVSIADSVLSSADCLKAAGGTVTDKGYNVVSPGSTTTTSPPHPLTTCGFSSADHDVTTSTSIDLSPLAANTSDGPETAAISTTSSAFEEVPSTSCTVTTDERGDTRPGVPGKNCDAGAYELQASSIPSTDVAPRITSNGSATFPLGSSSTFTVHATGTPTPTLAESGQLPTGVTFSTAGTGEATLSGTPAQGSASSYPITVTATNGVTPEASQSFTLYVSGPHVTLSPTSLTFGTVGVEQVSKPQTVTLESTGTQVAVTNVYITQSGSAFAFTGRPSCTGAIRPTGPLDSCTATVEFSPTGVGPADALLVLEVTGHPLDVALSGIGAPPAVSLSTRLLSFGHVGAGEESAPLSVVLTNTGAPATVTAVYIIGTGFGFIGKPVCTGARVTSVVSTSCTVTVHFSPTGIGQENATLYLDVTGVPFSVALSGVGVARTSVAISTPSGKTTTITFGAVDVGSSSEPQIVKIENTGENMLYLTTPTVTSTPTGQFHVVTAGGCAAGVAPDSACDVTVKFNPTVATSDLSGVLSIVTNGSGVGSGPDFTILLEGAGIGRPTVSETSPSIYYSSAAQHVKLHATVSWASEPVTSGTLTFSVLSGDTTIGTPVTRPLTSSGGATATYLVPAETPAGTYTIKALYTPAVSTLTAATEQTATLTVVAVVPSRPGKPTVTTGFKKATVSWTPPSTTGGSPVTSYTVTSTPGAVTCTWTARTGGPLACTVTGLSSTTKYTFSVVARNVAGTSAPSAASSAVTPKATVPAKPTAPSVTARNKKAVVSWTAPTTNGATITKYTVTAVTAKGTKTTCTTSGTTTAKTPTSCTVNGLTDGVSYQFSVVAHNAMGTSAASTPTTAIPEPQAPTAPRKPTVKAGAYSVTVRWAAPTNGGSKIEYYTVTSSTGSFGCTTTLLTCTVKGLTASVSHTFYVTATNAIGTSLPSPTSTPIEAKS